MKDCIKKRFIGLFSFVFVVALCAFCFSLASGKNGVNKVYADGTAVTITQGQAFGDSYNESNGWNIQPVANWKVSAKALSFDYKNNTGDAFTSFWFAGFAGEDTRVTSQTSVNLSSNTCTGATITDLGGGWYNLFINYADLGIYTAGGANGTETIDRVYFAGIGGNSLSLNNISNAEKAVFSPTTLTTGTTLSSGWNIQPVANWKTSAKALSFDYKNNTGDAFTSFTFTGYASGTKVTSEHSVNLTANTCSNTYATITDLGDGWYNLFINYDDMGIYTAGGANGTETLDRVYFAGIGGKSLSLNNINTIAEPVFRPVTITTGTTYSSGWYIQSVDNWSTSGYALSFDFKNNTGNTFTSFNYRLMYSGANRSNQIIVNMANNIVLCGNNAVGTITALGDGWYRVLMNYADTPVVATGTIDSIYFGSIAGNSLSLNNIDFKATPHSEGLAAQLTTGTNYTSANTGKRWNFEDVENWATSGYALSMDYKMVSGSNFVISVGNGSQRTRNVTIDTTNHTAMWGTTHYGIITALGDGWYRVIFNYKDWGSYNLAADATITTVSLTEVGGKTVLINNINTKAAEHGRGLPYALSAGCTFSGSNPTTQNWNIQSVANWKTSDKALYFEYKNVSGAAFYIMPQSGSGAQVARQITVSANNTVSFTNENGTGYGTVKDLGAGWYGVLINYADLGYVAAGDLAQFYFTGVGSNVIYVNSFNTVADAKYNPTTITTGTAYLCGWHIQSVDNWSTSGYALSFDFKNNTGNTFTSFNYRLMYSGANRSNQIIVNMANNIVLCGNNAVGTITALGNGWYRVLMNYADTPVAATGVMDTVYFAGIAGNSLSLNNIDFKATPHSEALAIQLTSGTAYASSISEDRRWDFEDVENWKTSGKALSFDYKNVSGAAFNITLQDASGTQRARQIAVNANNTVLFTGTGTGTVKALGDGWYNVFINYSDLGVYDNNGSTGAETIAKMYFTGVGNYVYINNINTVADEKYNPVTINTGTTYSSGWKIQSVDNWSTSGYALSFDFKNNTGNTFTSFNYRLMYSGANRSNQIIVNMANNIVLCGNNAVGTITALGDGWYRVLMNYADTPVEATGVMDSVYFAGIAGNSLSLNNINFKATAHNKGLAAQLTAGATYTNSNPTGRRWNFENVANWHNSGKALSFDYKNVSGAAFNITLQDASGTQRARQITVNADNTVSFTGLGAGVVSELADGWYNVVINYCDLGVYDNSTGAETIARMYFTGVGSNVIYVNNINTVESGKFRITVEGGTGGGTYDAGASCTVVAGAIANTDYFAGWINNATGAVLSYDKSYTFTVSGNISLTATTGTISPDADAHTVTPGAGYGCTFYVEDCSYLSFDYAITNGEDTYMMLTLDAGDYTNAYGYYTFYKLRANESYDGVTFTDLHNGFMRVEFDIAALTKIQGNGTSSVLRVFVRGGWTTATGYIQNVNVLAKYQFNMVSGASPRIDTRAKGMRFKSTINSFAYDADATYGMIIIPYDYIATYALSGDYVNELTDADVSFINLTCYPISDGAGGYYIQGTISDIKDKNINRAFIAFAYSLKDGVYTYATQNATANARTFSGLAESTLNDPDMQEWLDEEDVYGEKFRIKYLRDKIEAGSEDVSQSMDLYGTDAFNAFADYSFDYGITEETSTMSGYSVKFAATAAASGTKYALFNLNGTYNLTNKYISMDLKFIGAGNNLSIILYDGAGAVCEAYAYDFTAAGTDWVKWVITCNNLTLKAGKNLNNVRYVRFNFDFDTDSGFAQTVYMDNIKFTTGSQETTAFKGYSVDTLVQVKQTETSTINTQADYIQVSAAKGERETAQMILKKKSSVGEKHFTVSITDLEGSKGYIHSSCITAYMELYHNITARYDTTGWTYEYFDCYDGYTGTQVKDLPRGYLPDALLPMGVAVRAGQNKVGSAATQALFFVIQVPEDVASGIYHGFVNITIEDEGTINMPIQLQVYNFTMPTENAAKFVTGVGPEYIHSVYSDVNTERTSDMYIAASELLADHGVGIKPCGSQWSTSSLNTYIADLKRIANDDRIGAYNLAANYVNGIDLTLTGGGNSVNLENLTLYNVEDYQYQDTNVTITGLKTLFMRMANESTNACNLFKKAIVYLFDEPTTTAQFIQAILGDYAVETAKAYVLANVDFTGKLEVRDALEKLHNMVTITTAELKCYDDYNGYTISNVAGTYKNYCAIPSTITEGSTGYVVQYSEFWNYSGNNKYTELTAAMADSDYLVWWYGCIHPVYPYASYLLNAPYTIARTNRWQQFGLGIEGELYYCANRSVSEEDGEDPEYLTEAQILAGGINVGGGNGDGLLIYPVRDTYGSYGVKWLSSLRLENIAEGNDDYNYLVYAQSLIDGLSSGQAAYQTRLNNILATLYTTPMNNTENPATLRAARASLAALIEELVEA